MQSARSEHAITTHPSDAKVVSHSVNVGGRRTSVVVEEHVWAAIKIFAGTQGLTVSAYIDAFAQSKPRRNLSAELRAQIISILQSKPGALSELPQILQPDGEGPNEQAQANSTAVSAKLALQRACTRVGGQKRLAELINSSQPSVSYWLNRSQHGAGATYVKRIEAVTGVPCHELRPDIYPAPASD